MPPSTPEELAREIEKAIVGFMAKSENNNLGPPSFQRAWQRPLVGFAAGDDPIFDFFKKDIGPFFWLPREAFELAFPGRARPASGISVVSWVLPQMHYTKAQSAKRDKWPSELWARSRTHGESCNEGLRRAVVSLLADWGIPAAAPQLMDQWAIHDSAKYGRSSAWSERHAAHAAGLGTFGLCDGLITRAGKAHRVGSVIAGASILPTPRPYEDHHAYCLYFSHGICGECIKRCPVGAIGENGHDKVRCRAHAVDAGTPYVKKHYGLNGYACGLCQVGVPCESGIPVPPPVPA